MKRRLLLVSTLVVILACKNSKPVAESIVIETEEALLFAIDRGPCFGKCPVYTYQITTAGNVYYQGKNFSEPEGLHEFVLSLTTLNWLKAEIASAHLHKLDDEYLCNISDATTTTVTALTKEFSKTIIHRCGDQIELLLDLERRVDSLVFLQLLSE